MRDPVTESRLQREGVTYEYREHVQLTDIDVAGSLRNQARFDPLDRRLVERYALQMIDGAPFPAIILQTVKDQPLRALDGNHRLAAASEAERSEIDAYVLEGIDNLTQIRLVRTWNIANGKPPSADEILEHAIYLVDHTPYTIRDVAKMVAMSEKSLSMNLRARRTRDRLYTLGVPAEGLGLVVLDTLGQLTDSNVLSEAAKLTIRAALPQPRVTAMVQEVKGAASEDARLGIVKSWGVRSKTAVAVAGGGRFARTAKRAQVSRLLGQLNRVSTTLGRDPSAYKLGLLTREDFDALQGGYTEVVNRMRRLLDSAQSIVRAPEVN